jgi:transketolase
MAMAARQERGLLDPDALPGQSPFDHRVYVLASDGDLMEGVSSKASSLAGHQQLGDLVVIYDQDHVSIEDETDISFSEDVAGRHQAYGWHVQSIGWTGTGAYVEDIDALLAAITAAQAEQNRPSTIVLRTIIGWPAPRLQGTGKAHGAALGQDEITATKRLLVFDPEQARSVQAKATRLHQEWQASYEIWRANKPQRAALLDRLSRQQFPPRWSDVLPVFDSEAKGMATRKVSGAVLDTLAPVLPERWGGSADLPSPTTRR